LGDMAEGTMLLHSKKGVIDDPRPMRVRPKSSDQDVATATGMGVRIERLSRKEAFVRWVKS